MNEQLYALSVLVLPIIVVIGRADVDSDIVVAVGSIVVLWLVVVHRVVILLQVVFGRAITFTVIVVVRRFLLQVHLDLVVVWVLVLFVSTVVVLVIFGEVGMVIITVIVVLPVVVFVLTALPALVDHAFQQDF